MRSPVFVPALIVLAAILVGCSDPPPPPKPVDPTTEAGYAQTVTELKSLTAQAEAKFHDGKKDEASNLIQQAEPLQSTVLNVEHPTLAAAIAAADLDSLYGRMLLSSRNYVWAQTLFQKNLARWKHWQPQTDDTARRVKEAQDQIAECERGMEK